MYKLQDPQIWIRPRPMAHPVNRPKVIHYGYWTDESRFDSRCKHRAGPLYGPPKVRRSERQTKLSRACSVVGGRQMNSRLDVVSSRGGKTQSFEARCAQRLVCAACSNPLPGSLPTEQVCLPTAQPSLSLQFHPNDTQQTRSLITALHHLQGMMRTVVELV